MPTMPLATESVFFSGSWDPFLLKILLVTGILGGDGIPKLEVRHFLTCSIQVSPGFRTPRHQITDRYSTLSTPQKNDCPNCPIIGTSDEI